MRAAFDLPRTMAGHGQVEPIGSFRKTWMAACRAAGVPGRLVHDFRRTAVRNLERAGVPRSAAMAMVGHKTEAIYRSIRAKKLAERIEPKVSELRRK